MQNIGNLLATNMACTSAYIHAYILISQIFIKEVRITVEDNTRALACTHTHRAEENGSFISYYSESSQYSYFVPLNDNVD